MLATLDDLADALTPSPIAITAMADQLGEDFSGWQRLARGPEQDRGRLDRWSLDHLDMLVELERTWPAHAAGDTLLHADMLTMTKAGRAASREGVAATVCALAGFFTERSLQPPPPGIPTVRAFQAAQGAIAFRWLALVL